MRRASAEATRRIALRYGKSLPIWIGGGYPKSGTVWLCQLMGSYLGVPYPRNYRLPIAMESVIHSHWSYDSNFHSSAYIRRDGRDVMVSYYFYFARALSLSTSPRRNAALKRHFESLYGANFDLSKSKENLPKFIESSFANPKIMHDTSWHLHILDWWDRKNVFHTRYEDLLENTPAELTRLMSELTGEVADPVKVASAVNRYSFVTASGRKPGQEERSSFLRKGQSGDWRNHFTVEAAQVFDAFAGEALVEFGYADSRSWVSEFKNSLPSVE